LCGVWTGYENIVHVGGDEYAAGWRIINAVIFFKWLETEAADYIAEERIPNTWRLL
jgi:hypothetical protein